MGPDTTTSQVQVRFSTKQAEYAITETPILLPTTLTRPSLSEVVNRLHGKTDDADFVGFSFLVSSSQSLLRTSLKTYLDAHHLSTETTMDLEYFEASPAPKFDSDQISDDWMSAVDFDAAKQIFVTASYDASVSVLDSSFNIIASVSPHSMPVKDVKVLYPSNDDVDINSLSFLSASLDNLLVCTTLDLSSRKFTQNYSIMHPDSVSAIASSPSSPVFATGCQDARIRLFTTSMDDTISVEEETARNKRRKLDQAAQTKVPTMTLEGHNLKITGLNFNPRDTNIVYSSALDTTVRVWDIQESACTRVLVRVSLSACRTTFNTNNAT